MIAAVELSKSYYYDLHNFCTTLGLMLLNFGNASTITPPRQGSGVLRISLSVGLCVCLSTSISLKPLD